MVEVGLKRIEETASGANLRTAEEEDAHPDSLSGEELARLTSNRGLLTLLRQRGISPKRALSTLRYEAELEKLQIELVRLQRSIQLEGRRVAILFEGVPEFEHMLYEDGVEVIKFWFSSSKDEQAQRFEFSRSHTTFSPWIIVKANNKKRARLESMRYVLSRLDYQGKDDSGTNLHPDPDIVRRFHRSNKQID
jgi:polyphosphate kinase 2 (PPK2 family)